MARWSRIAVPSGPSARSSHGISGLSGMAYLFGGEGMARHAIDSTVHRLDVHCGEWTTCGSVGATPAPRVGHAPVSYTHLTLPTICSV